MGVRRHLRWIALCWMASYSAALGAMPFGTCTDHVHAPAVEGAHHHGHGEHPCAKHHHEAGAQAHQSPPADAPTITCRCRVSESALAPILVGNGLPIATFRLMYRAVGEPLREETDGIRSPGPSTDTPPPRI